MRKKLYRSREHTFFAGICGGIGEYLNTDPTVIRVLYLLIAVITGILPGVLVYIILIFVIPLHPKSWREEEEYNGPPHRPWS